jgi:hypothetical protein
MVMAGNLCVQGIVFRSFTDVERGWGSKADTLAPEASDQQRG